MIQTQSILNVADNSGAKKVMCIKILGGSRKRYAYIGDIIKVSVKLTTPNCKIKKGEIFKAVLIRSKHGVKRINGTCIKFDYNSVVLLNIQEQPIGTRITGPVTEELRGIKFMKLISLAPEII